MIRQVEYKSHTYGPAQREALWRALARNGWVTAILAHPIPAGTPNTKGRETIWYCQANRDHGLFAENEDTLRSRGDSLWDCLSKMVEEIKKAEGEKL